MSKRTLKESLGYKELLAHRGHAVVIVTYGPARTNVSLECEDCFEVIVDFNRR